MIYWFLLTEKERYFKKIKERPNYNAELLNIFRKIKLEPKYKKKKSHFIIKNTFIKKPVKIEIKKILNKIL